MSEYGYRVIEKEIAVFEQFYYDVIDAMKDESIHKMEFFKIDLESNGSLIPFMFEKEGFDVKLFESDLMADGKYVMSFQIDWSNYNENKTT